jgi:MSHA biogenesis protein MshM
LVISLSSGTAKRCCCRDEIGAYIEHRLAIAGLVGGPLFDASALRALHRASRGVPRLVNILAHKALLLVFGEGGRCASRSHVHAAAVDTPSAAPVSGWWWLRLRTSRATD